MIKGTVSFYDGRPAAGVVIGAAEDVLAPRGLAALEKGGMVVDDSVALAFKAYLALKRQGDVDASVKFEDWVLDVSEIDVQPSRKQLEMQVVTGMLTREQADQLLELMGDGSGEAKAQPV